MGSKTVITKSGIFFFIPSFELTSVVSIKVFIVLIDFMVNSKISK